MKLQPQQTCPLDSFNPCRQMGCGWFIQIAGTNPNTGEEVGEWGCAMAWLPLLLVENASQSRQTGAAVESFRNAVLQAPPVHAPPVSGPSVSAPPVSGPSVSGPSGPESTPRLHGG